MRLTFPRNADRWHGCEAVREDGVLLQIPRYDRASAALPHDLAHYVVECELGLTRGFWGSVYAGWIATGNIAILSVPSAVIPEEQNYLLNPAHLDFKRIEIGAAKPFRFDPRMWKGSYS